MRTCALIPVYNGAKTIEGLIRSAKPYVNDILVVDDGSTDETVRVAGMAGATVISFKQNRGKGKVLKDGFERAIRGDYDAVITMDADGQHEPGDILKIIAGAAPAGTGVVVGNRMSNPGDMPPVRLATNIFMSLIISILCGQNIPDTQCGYRLIKSDVLRRIRLVSSNYEIESELLIKAARLGYKIVSVPVKSIYAGQVSLINPLLDTWRFLVMLGRALLT
ncbi:MAG: glycosyltransferase family 2 protein [Candidatus Omnitrophica bacterium]|nr:glycosyltransferase family 2 protein [Candidatus Omnitrophota bacterium]